MKEGSGSHSRSGSINRTKSQKNFQPISPQPNIKELAQSKSDNDVIKPFTKLELETFDTPEPEKCESPSRPTLNRIS